MMRSKVDYTDKTIQKRDTALLLLILLLAFVLRIIGIGYGLPYTYILDETFLVNHALAFGTGDFNPHFFEWPGSLLMYVLFFIYGAYFGIGFVAGFFKGPEDFALSYIADPTKIYLISRFFIVVTGVAIVYAAYRVGKRMYGSTVGLITAFFLSAAPLLAGVSHFTITDTPLTLFCILPFLMFQSILKEGQQRDYMIAGLLIGLGIAVKFNAGALLIPLMTVHLLKIIKEDRPLIMVLIDRRLFTAILAIGVGFWVGCPFSLFDFKTFFGDILFQLSRIHNIGMINAEYNSPVLFYLREGLQKGLGTGILLLSLAGIIIGFFRRKSEDFVLLSFVIIYFFYTVNLKTTIDKYIMPILPHLGLLAAIALEKIFQHRLLVRKSVLQFLIIILIIAEPFYFSIQTDLSLLRKDTRTLALEWIETHIPPHTKIAVDSGRFDVAKLSPPLNDSLDNLYNIYAAKKADEKNKLKQQEGEKLEKYFNLIQKARRNNPPAKTYSLQRIVISADGSIEQSVSLESFAERGVEYIVISSFAYEGYDSPAYKKNYPEAASFYASFYHQVQKRCNLFKEFPAEPGFRQGPTIKIFKLET